MQHTCACCEELIRDSESDKPLEFDSGDPRDSLCESCEQWRTMQTAGPSVPWDIYLNCPAGSPRKQ
jgi:hypothetical protein